MVGLSPSLPLSQQGPSDPTVAMGAVAAYPRSLWRWWDLPWPAAVGGPGHVPSRPVPWQEQGKIMPVKLSDEALSLVQEEQRAGAQTVYLVEVSESAGRCMKFACKTCTIH